MEVPFPISGSWSIYGVYRPAGAGRREIKYKGRRGGGEKGETKETKQQRGKKGAGAMDRPRTKSPDFISTASFVLKEGRQDKGTVTSSIPHSLAHSCQHKKDGCDGVSAPQYKWFRAGSPFPVWCRHHEWPAAHSGGSRHRVRRETKRHTAPLEFIHLSELRVCHL